MKKIISISVLCFLLLNGNLLAQNKKLTKKLPDKEFTKFFGGMICNCVESGFAGFSPEFMKIWSQIGVDFRTKGGADLAGFYAHLKNDKSDSLRFNKIEDNVSKSACEDNTDTIDNWEDKYDFDVDKDIKIYLARNFNDIMNYLKKDKKCPNSYILWTLVYIKLAEKK